MGVGVVSYVTYGGIQQQQCYTAIYSYDYSSIPHDWTQLPQGQQQKIELRKKMMRYPPRTPPFYFSK